MKRKHLVYKLGLSDNTIYYGVTNNLNRRLISHKYERSAEVITCEIVKSELSKQDAYKLETKMISENDCCNKFKKNKNIMDMTILEILKDYGDLT